MDGTGKTTLAKTLVERLRAQGEDARYVYARYRPVTIRVPWAAARLFLRSREAGGYHAYRDEKRSKMRRSKFRKAYATWLLAEYVIELQLLVGVPLARGKTIVCDRYVFDSAIMEVGKELGLSDDECVGLAAKWGRLVPRPDRVLVLDVPEEVAFARKDDVPHIDYLREVRATYAALAKANGFAVIDARQQASVVAEQALKRINRG